MKARNCSDNLDFVTQFFMNFDQWLNGFAANCILLANAITGSSSWGSRCEDWTNDTKTTGPIMPDRPTCSLDILHQPQLSTYSADSGSLDQETVIMLLVASYGLFGILLYNPIFHKQEFVYNQIVQMFRKHLLYLVLTIWPWFPTQYKFKIS